MKLKKVMGLSAVMLALSVVAEAKEPVNPVIGAASTIFMRKGPVEVTEADFEAQLAELSDSARGQVQHDKKAIKKVLEDLYVRKTLAQEARDAKLDQDPLVRNRMALVVDRFLAQERLDAVVKEAPRPDFEALAKEKYIAHPEQFETPESVRVSHILITIKGRTKEDAQKLADKVRAEVLEGKQSFAELVKKYSEDASAGTNQGDLGFFGPGMMVKDFEQAAYALKKKGDISPVVKTDFGFHIIRLEDRVPGHKSTFDEIKAGMISEAEQKYFSEVRGRYMVKTNSADGVYVNLEAIDKLYKPISDIPLALPLKGAPAEIGAKAK
ncbi:MAG: peptidylprolyl isomerase [Gammaproteobacteria bacterium]|nr:peptidylprolyl isomerase [Gammaproteobacteria bacterium]